MRSGRILTARSSIFLLHRAVGSDSFTGLERCRLGLLTQPARLCIYPISKYSKARLVNSNSADRTFQKPVGLRYALVPFRVNQTYRYLF
jgi:hypothetical protein